MQEFNLDAFSDFIKRILFEELTVEDYILVIEELFDTRPKNTHSKFISFKSMCHNVDLHKCGYNLALNTENMIFTCYSHCGSFDLLELLVKRYELIGEPKSRYKCMALICKTCGIPFEFADTEEKVIEYDWKKDIGKYSKKNKKKIDKQEIKVYNDDVLEYFPKVYHEDWINYGISEQTMEKFNIRWYPYKQQIVIPCYNHLGQLVGARVRNMNEQVIEDGTPRYMPLFFLNSDDMKFPTNSILFGEYQNESEIRKQKCCYLCESEKSVLRLDTLMNGKGIALGMMGSALSDANVKCILSLGINRLVILADSDFHEMSDEDEDWVKFEQKIMKLCDKFTPFCKVEVVFNNIGIEGMYKASVTDFTVEQFKEMYKNRVKIN